MTKSYILSYVTTILKDLCSASNIVRICILVQNNNLCRDTQYFCSTSIFGHFSQSTLINGRWKSVLKIDSKITITAYKISCLFYAENLIFTLCTHWNCSYQTLFCPYQSHGFFFIFLQNLQVSILFLYCFTYLLSLIQVEILSFFTP